jgi:DUF1680 family protein
MAYRSESPGSELTRGTDSNECCCAYNMLKLTRQLYTWSADPRLFDYYASVVTSKAAIRGHFKTGQRK